MEKPELKINMKKTNEPATATTPMNWRIIQELFPHNETMDVLGCSCDFNLGNKWLWNYWKEHGVNTPDFISGNTSWCNSRAEAGQFRSGMAWTSAFHMQAQVFTEKVSCQDLFWKEEWVECCILSSWRGGMLWRGFASFMGVLLSEMPITKFQLLLSMLSSCSACRSSSCEN